MLKSAEVGGTKMVLISSPPKCIELQRKPSWSFDRLKVLGNTEKVLKKKELGE
jgi:hypothetical protein